MSPRDAVRALAFGRVGLGVAILLFPRLVTRLSVGPLGHAGTVTVLGRALGVRDALVGGMTLHTADHPQVAKRWITACAAIDAVDFTAALTAPGLPPARRRLFCLIAGGSAVAHAALAGPASAAAESALNESS